MKPLLHVSVFYMMKSTNAFAKALQKKLGDKYDIVFTPNPLVDIKTDNMVTLIIDKDTNLDELIEKLDKMEYTNSQLVVPEET